MCNFFVQRLPKSAKKGNEKCDGPLVSKLLDLIVTKTDKDFQFFCEAQDRVTLWMCYLLKKVSLDACFSG